MGKNQEKTNVMRVLEQKKIPYESHNYLETGAVSGLDVARVLGEDPDRAFKTPLTGYVHGGCSPIGMKKQFVTTIDESAGKYDRIMFSAGKIGYQVEVSLADLGKVIRFQMADIAE